MPAQSRLILTWKDRKSGQKRYVAFDAVSTENHEWLSKISTHPVDEGADVADHVRPEMERVTIEGFVSEKPLIAGPFVSQLAAPQKVPLKYPPQEAKAFGSSASDFSPGALTKAVKGAVTDLLGLKTSLPTSATALAFKDPALAKYRPIGVLAELVEARNSAALIHLQSAIRAQENWVIEKISVPRSEPVGGLHFEVDLVHVRIAHAETVKAPEPAEARGAATKSLGSKAAQKTDPKKAGPLASIMAQGFDATLGRDNLWGDFQDLAKSFIP